MALVDTLNGLCSQSEKETLQSHVSEQRATPADVACSIHVLPSEELVRSSEDESVCLATSESVWPALQG